MKKCKVCEKSFTPLRPLQSVCSPRCALQKVRQEKIQDRQETRKKRNALKTIAQLEEECRRIVQAIARIRDRNDGCISCHMGPNYGGVWHGSHYRSHGSCSSLQFHLWNIHKSCAQCNLHKSGNIAEYRPRLIKKIGSENVDWLESQPKSKKFTREYLERFKRVMGRRKKRLEKLLA